MRNPVLLVGIILVTLVSCQPRKTVSEKPSVTVSIAPFSFFANALAGDHFKVNILVPPGANHHAYDPAPRQMQELENSRALFVDGHLGFEMTWIPRFRANYPELKIIDLSRDIGLITEDDAEGSHDAGSSVHHHEGVEPHYWMSPKAAKVLATNMARGLQMADSKCSQLVSSNLDRLLKRIDSLDRVFETRLAGLRQNKFIIFHPALTYLARDYGLKQIAMELGGKDPTASHFKNLVDEAKNNKINTIFVQREYDRENAETLSREIGATIVIIDPMSPDWMAEMGSLLDKLLELDNIR